MSNPATDFIEETASGSGSGSDSDTNSEESPEYYQPISAAENEELGSDSEPEQPNSDEDHNNNNNTSNYHRLPNGHIHHAENGISALDLNNDDIDEEEEEVRSEVTSDSAIWIAFREDESRRNAPLTPENATRVMEAMRGISFSGIAPEWANGVPEDRWINQLRRLRQSPQTTTTSTTIHP